MDYTTDSYGSARWANEADFQKEGLFSVSAAELSTELPYDLRSRSEILRGNAQRRAFILAKHGDPYTLMDGIREGYEQATGGFFSGLASLFNKNRSSSYGADYIGWAGDGHLLTVAPTRSGKGVGVVIPNLLNYPGSVLVVDPKGENYAITHSWREEVLGQQIVCLDPFHIVCDTAEGSDSINPFDGVVDYKKDPSTYATQNPEILDEANMIADSLIMRDAEEKDPHWNDKCRTLLKGVVLAVMCGMGPHKARHLSEVRELLTSGTKAFDRLLARMALDETSAGGLLKRASLEIQSMGGEEFKNVVSFALKHTEFLDSPVVGECLGVRRLGYRGTYNLRDMKRCGGVSIYMVLPPHYLARYVRLFRLWITMAMAAMTRSPGLPADGCQVLFMLDEMAQLGTMDMMRQAVSLLAGYGMSIWMIWQDLSQLKSLYKTDWSSFIANAKIQQFFGINDHETAKFISEMLGEATIQIATTSSASSRSKQNTSFFEATNTRNVSQSFSEKERCLLSPDEVRRLNRTAMLMFVQGVPPILAERIAYYEDWLLSNRADENACMTP